MIVDLTSDIVDVDAKEESKNEFPYEMRLVRKKNAALTEVYQALKEIVLTTRLKVSCQWNYDEEEFCYSPTLLISSSIHKDRQYRIAIHFLPNYPDSHPTFEPLDLLPAISYLTIYYHPILCPKYWTSSQSLTEIIQLVSLHLDRLPSIPSLEHIKFTPKGKSTKTNLHSLVTDLYSIYKDEIKGYAYLEQVLLSLFPENFCIFLGSTTGASSSSTVGKGIGYTSGYGGFGGSKPAKTTQKTTKTKSEEIIEQIDKIFTTKITDFHSAEWMIESPLIDILTMILKQLSREEISRHSTHVASIYKILLRCDQTLSTISTNIAPIENSSFSSSSVPLSSASAASIVPFARLQQVQELITSSYGRLLDPVVREIFSGKNPWLKDICDSTLFPPNTIDLEKEDADKEGGSQGVQTTKQRVFHLPDIEKNHYFLTSPSYSHSSSSSPGHVKCSKAWLKELNFIEENLMDELVLFISEEHPNYLIALMHITNPDSPYYGGTYVFHILIPADYPSSSPKVQFMTTGGGTVRFNPNLYNCGKVCLSLLGTWAGEPWSPKTSNLTQVLKSILFLIFTEEPFYNEPGYQYTQRLAPQSLQYNYNIMMNNLKFAILTHLQTNYGTNAASSVKNEFIFNYVKDYYHVKWYQEILPHLTEKLSTIYKPLSNFQTTLNAINALIPVPPPPPTPPATAATPPTANDHEVAVLMAEGVEEEGMLDASFVDLTNDQRPRKRRRKSDRHHHSRTSNSNSNSNSEQTNVNSSESSSSQLIQIIV